MIMRIGIISDIHNNFVALDIILKEFENRNCDLVICSGDIIGIGPSPEETVQRIKTIKDKLVVVQGNHEHYLTKGMSKSKMSNHEYLFHKWEHSKLSDNSKDFLMAIPNQENLNINGYRILICHYGMDNERYKGLIRNPNTNQLRSMFDSCEADIVVYGHDHAPSYIESSKVYINPGSLGCPGRTKNIARAGILDLTDGIKYNQLSMEYDVSKVINLIEEYDYPAKNEILQFFFGLYRKESGIMNDAPTILIDEELLIRKPKESDIDERFKLGRSLEFRRMVGGSMKHVPSFDYDNAERLYQREMKNKYSWFIEYQGRMIGVCRLTKQDTGNVRYSIGIYDDTLFSKGIGTRVTNEVLKFAFNELKLEEVELMVLEYNKRAIRCYEKCGFVTTKVLTDNLELDGEKHSDLIMKISIENFRKKEGGM